MNRVQQMKKVQEEGLELFKRKNSDYGDSFANYGPIGVIIRMGDKQLDTSISRTIKELKQTFNKNLYIKDF